MCDFRQNKLISKQKNGAEKRSLHSFPVRRGATRPTLDHALERLSSMQNDMQREFFSRVAPESQFYHLFDYLPGISFFVKDRDFRLIAANRSFLERLGAKDEQSILGKNDFELFPTRLAEAFRVDDQEVIKTGAPKLRIVELFINPQGMPDWYMTNKLPVFDSTGQVMGVMGTVEDYHEVQESQEPFEVISKAVRFIRENYRSQIQVKELAKTCGISERQLHRKFLAAFNASPLQFVLKTRLHSAFDELTHTKKPISEIALDHGFYDQSSFTQHFKRQFGVTPLRQRKRHQANGGRAPAPQPTTENT